jgi:acyl-CoA hydrolase
MSKPISYDPNWQETYQPQILGAAEAVKKIRPGQRIFIGTGVGEPLQLVSALTKRAVELPDTEIVHLLTFGAAPYAHRELAQYFRVNSFFIAENVRDIIQEGLGDYTPIHLSDIPRLFDSGQLPLDVALIQVTPPDKDGICSLGVSVDIVKSATANASLVIAQVNPRMPRTLGDSFIHAYDIDVLVPGEEAILEVKPPEVTDTTKQIAENLSALIEDGSTLEIGLGRIPQALVSFLKDKKDLGVHTEMISDDVIELIEAGVITGARKTVDRGKVVTSFCLGTQKLYDLVDNNPMFAFHPTEYVNSPFIIHQQHKMVAINTALEIDLTGQVCADSLGAKFFSGVGGQVDFNRGAAKAPGGKAVIALPSTAKCGSVSRIVVQLSPAASSPPGRACFMWSPNLAWPTCTARACRNARWRSSASRIRNSAPTCCAKPLKPNTSPPPCRTRRAKSWSARRNCARPICSTTARCSIFARFIRPMNRGCATCFTSYPKQRFIIGS